MTETSRSAPSLTRRSLIVGGALALTAGGAYAATPRRTEHRLAHRKLGTLIARRIGPWSITNPAGVIVTNEETEQTDGYDQLLTRVYQAPGLPTIMLLIAYGSTQGGSLQLHRPETCYPGQGFSTADHAVAPIDIVAGPAVSARRFTASRGERIERVLYWTRISNRFPLNTAGEYAAIIGSVIQGVIPDGVLVRISTVGPDPASEDVMLVRFAQQMVESASPAGQQILLGRTIGTAGSETAATHSI